MTKDDLEIALTALGWTYEEYPGHTDAQGRTVTIVSAKDPTGFNLANGYEDERSGRIPPSSVRLCAKMAREGLFKAALERATP